MGFELEKFIASPSEEQLKALKKSELVQVAEHYEIKFNSSMNKSEIKTLVVNYLVEEELLPETSLAMLKPDQDLLAIRKLELEFQERKEERERELQLRKEEREQELKFRELELKERELLMQTEVKMKEFEAQLKSNAQATSPKTDKTFDVAKNVRLVPPFQEKEVDKFFLHFEKIATSLKWPKEFWPLLIQSVLTGKAQIAYSSLSIEQSAVYETVKRSILKAYELVPEAYRQKFRNTRKQEGQTFVELAREKERLFDRWAASKEIDGDFQKLKQLMLIEEFKRCISNDLKTHLDEQKANTLEQAAILADDYALTHKSFGYIIKQGNLKSGHKVSPNRNPVPSGNQTNTDPPRDRTQYQSKVLGMKTALQDKRPEKNYQLKYWGKNTALQKKRDRREYQSKYWE